MQFYSGPLMHFLSGVVLSDVPRVSGPASAIVDGSELSWRRLPPEAKAVIPQSGRSLTTA
jgi:hypothetical protein